MPLKVGGAFHTPFMSQARDRLRKAIEDTEIREPNRPVFANVDGLAHTVPSEWASLMGAQLTSPVRWRSTLHNMHDAGANVFLELGPGTVLTGMVKRTLKGATKVSVSTPGDVDKLLDALSHGSETGGVVEGEVLAAVERLVVSPANGVFEPATSVDIDQAVNRGDLIGTVGDHDVRSAFSGRLQGLLAMSGERVTTSQPIAWLRVDDHAAN